MIDQSMTNVDPNIMTQITDNVFIGNVNHAQSFEWLRRNGITHIVNCTRELDNYYVDQFTYLKLHLRDLETQSLRDVLVPSYDFIETAVQNRGMVLIHCNAGISRSSSILIYYLMRKHNWRFYRALAYVKNLYPRADPNIGFGNQLVNVIQTIHPDDEIL
jgi:protein-tyrosine phosphatase